MTVRLVDHLSDNYNKHQDSNNAKLLGLVDGELNELASIFQSVARSRDMDKATGATLDKAGKNVLEYRAGKRDDIYRDHIKTKIKADLSKGDIPTINEIAEFFLGDALIGVEETWGSGLHNNEVAGLVVHMHPVFRTIPSVLKRVVAGGVRLWWLVDMHSDTINIVTHTRAWLFNYPKTGQAKLVSRYGHALKGTLQLQAKPRLWTFDLPMVGEARPEGPLGAMVRVDATLKTHALAYTFDYPLCGDLKAGEVV